MHVHSSPIAHSLRRNTLRLSQPTCAGALVARTLRAQAQIQPKPKCTLSIFQALTLRAQDGREPIWLLRTRLAWGWRVGACACRAGGRAAQSFDARRCYPALVASKVQPVQGLIQTFLAAALHIPSMCHASHPPSLNGAALGVAAVLLPLAQRFSRSGVALWPNQADFACQPTLCPPSLCDCEIKGHCIA